MNHRTRDELESGMDEIRAAPADRGVVRHIVLRPDVDQRTVLQSCELSPGGGMHGDRWAHSGRGSSPSTDMQVSIMNVRVIDLLAGDRDRWALAGDNLYVDFDK